MEEDKPTLISLPTDIIIYIISYLDPESAMTLYANDPSIRHLFPKVSDVKTALRNSDIVNLRRLTDTIFPIDKDTYKLACASGVMKFIELLEEREPKSLKEYEYNTDIHKCFSWTDAGLIEGIKNKRIKVVRKLMERKKQFAARTNYEIVDAGVYSNDPEIMDLIDDCIL